ncbi:MAG: hypothetical protein IJ835_02560 [Muribaculaceae bacterium]|nr:hypothetical protein [Muribaculaceae bacterium]
MRKILLLTVMLIAISATAQIKVTATKYHPGRGGAGWVTASGDRIDNKKLKRYEIRWVALSPDLYGKLGVKYNDKVEITCPTNSRLNGVWIVKDRMGKRLRNRIDLLLPAGDTMHFKAATTMYIKKL